MAQKTCSYCGKPVEKEHNMFLVPVCDSAECRAKYFNYRNNVYEILAHLGGRTLS